MIYTREELSEMLEMALENVLRRLDWHPPKEELREVLGTAQSRDTQAKTLAEVRLTQSTVANLVDGSIEPSLPENTEI